MTTNYGSAEGDPPCNAAFLIGGLVLVTMFLGRIYLVPLHPVLGRPPPRRADRRLVGGGCVVGRFSLVASGA